jgi:hypothetical protein
LEGLTVTMDSDVANNTTDPVQTLIYKWTANPAAGVTISDSNILAPTVTIVEGIAFNLFLSNGSFESPWLGNGGKVTTAGVSSWGTAYLDTEGAWQNDTSPAGGARNPADGVYAAIPDGVNVGYLRADPGVDHCLRQTLSENVEASTVYDLSLKVGNPTVLPTNDYRVELLAGSTIIASAGGASPDGIADEWFDVSLTYTSDANEVLDPNVGQTLAIRLIAEADVSEILEVNFDAVELLIGGVSGTDDLESALSSTVTMTLAVTYDGYTYGPRADSMIINVYETTDACAAMIASKGTLDLTDFDTDCITNLSDFAVMAQTWLFDRGELTEPVEKFVALPVPDVVGLTQAAAEIAIEVDFIVGTVTTAFSPTVAAGNVISQSPIAGMLSAPDSPVDIEVSLGMEDDTTAPTPDPMTFADVPAPGGAALFSQLGILDLAANGGINPATSAAWAEGDTYRLAFFTSATTDATSSDIATYNTWVQGLANATTAYDIGVDESVVWKVIASSSTVDAIVNTLTDPIADGVGEAVYLLDGSTLVASDNADLWDGEIDNIIDLTEQGTIDSSWPFTGTSEDGTSTAGKPTTTGSTLGNGGDVSQGNSSVTTEWIWRMWTGTSGTDEGPMYALSDPLTIGAVVVDPSTQISMLATTATDPSGVEYYFTCTLGGGNDSLWQNSRTYTDTGLTPSTEYTYTVTARDKSTAQNATAASDPESATTGS